MNNKIIEEFERLIKYKYWEFNNAKIREEKIHKSFSIEKTKQALNIIKKYNKEIKNEKELNELKNMKGIGKKTIDRIKEILKNGNLKEIKEDKIYENYDKKNYHESIKNLEEIIGIGKSKAHEFVTKHNIKTVDDLIKKYNNKEIKLNDKILLGLKYHNVYKQNIPRIKITEIDGFLYDVYPKINKQLFGIICGSYRRQKPYSGDIDVLITHPEIKTYNQLINQKNNYLKQLVKYLKQINFLVDDLTDKNVINKYMGFCKFKDNPVWRIDFRYVPDESYYTALLYFTGSGKFNTKMREHAINMGYKLSEYGLYEEKTKKKIKINSEKDIFDKLGLEYISPEKRD